MPFPIIPGPIGPHRDPDPDPRWDIPRACCRIVVDHRRGTGWLVERNRFVTCAHLVQRIETGGTVEIEFHGKTIHATLEAMDRVVDIAILRIPQPITHVDPLPLAEALQARVPWTGFGWTGAGQGVWLRGVVVNHTAVDRFGDPKMSLTGKEFVHRMLTPGHGLSGSPVLVDGKVVGHLHAHVAHSDSVDRAYSHLVYAASIDRLLKMLDRPSIEAIEPDEHGPEPLDACAGERYHAFVVYRGADAGFANRLMTRLEGSGVSTFPAQHEELAGFELSTEERRAWDGSRLGLVLFSRHWLVDEASRVELEAAALKEAARGSRFEIVLLRLDESPIPEAFREFRVIDFCHAPPDHGTSLRRLQFLFLPPAPEPGDDAAGQAADARLESWITFEDVRDEIVRELHDARGQPKRLKFIAKRWCETGMPGDNVPLLAAEHLIDAGRPDAAAFALEAVGTGIRARQLRARVKAATGRAGDALPELEALQAEGVSDAATGTLLGDEYARLWEDSGRQRPAWLHKAFTAYERTFRTNADPVAGIRAAALAMFEARVDHARELAGRVRATLERRVADPDTWAAAAGGVASLIMGDREGAKQRLREAMGIEPDAMARLAKIRDTVRMVLDGATGDAAGEGKGDGIESVLDLPGVAAFLGDRSEIPMERARATADEEEKGRRRIGDVLVRHGIGYGVCGLATEEDLVFAEALRAVQAGLEVVLPFQREAFVEGCVAPTLRSRVERVLSTAKVTVWMDTVPEADRIPNVLREAAAEVERLAATRAAEVGHPPVLIELVDPESDEAAADSGAVAAELSIQAEPASPPAAGTRVGVEHWRPVVVEQGDTRNIHRTNKVESPGREPRDYPVKHLVVVGIDAYAEWKPLANAVNDAMGVADTLGNESGFEVTLVKNEEATADRIRDAVTKDLASRVSEKDLVLFFFAGHGHTERGKDDRDHGFLVPVEGRIESTEGLLKMEEVVSWTRQLPCDDVLYIFDSCFSGFAGLAESVTERGGPHDARIAISAGTTEQPVLDGGAPGGAGNHSVFTGWLLRGLVEDIPAGPGEPINAMTLFTYLLDKVDKATKSRQTPAYGFFTGHGLGNIWIPGRKSGGAAADA